MPTTIQLKRGLSAHLGGVTLLAGEPAFTTDTGKLYVGNGNDKVLINPTLGTAANANLGTAAGNVPVLGVDGKLENSVIPKIAITDTFVVANQAAMLALTAEVGDVAIRTDLNSSFILRATPATEIGNWTELMTPETGVASINGKTGVVTIGANDFYMSSYSLPATPGSVTSTDTISEAIAKVEKTATIKAPLASPSFTGTVTAPTPSTSDNSTAVATTAFVKSQGYVTASSAPVTSVNTKIGAIVLDPRDLAMTGYVQGTSAVAITPTDTLSAALGKLEFGKAATASPTFTGIPTAPTATNGTNTTQVATTAFVQTALGVIDGGTF